MIGRICRSLTYSLNLFLIPLPPQEQSKLQLESLRAQDAQVKSRSELQLKELSDTVSDQKRQIETLKEELQRQQKQRRQSVESSVVSSAEVSKLIAENEDERRRLEAERFSE